MAAVAAAPAALPTYRRGSTSVRRQSRGEGSLSMSAMTFTS
jgi:hypothetical protein